MKNDQYSVFNDYFQHNLISDMDEKLLTDLKRGGFVVEDNIDEIELIKLNLMSSRYSTEHLGLTIATTINCNLGCTYCYEKDNKNAFKMSDEVHQAIINFVRSRANTISTLGITWYGGEPLIGMDTIRYLSKEFMSICEEHNIEYNAGIITNGYLLTPKIAEELKNYKVNFAQITIDGPEHIHDQRRPLIGGQPTFKKILQNTKEASNILNSISIRINTDETNKMELDSLLDVLEEYNLKEKTVVYLGHVHNSNECYSTNMCLTTESYSHTGYEFDKKAANRGFNTGHISTPSPQGSFCTADSNSSFVIDPEGFIYQCWVDIGNKEEAVGNLVNLEHLGNTAKLLDYLMYEPFEDPMCRDCKYLPVCMGGCPHSRLHHTVDRCTNYKYIMEKKLLDYADFTISNRELVKS
ncbi:radical SAM/SPASM domain-containing protein [Paenibacillus sp. CAA11]|uniref:radical SAM/SPASM domain-containing protein n=1 Tax=Paenibacillus sp. CAA11 TaxID=1532905 RepID=UPI001F19491D|nr:radical SAM protein [Paenibacillus sp. CAA11]